MRQHPPRVLHEHCLLYTRRPNERPLQPMEVYDLNKTNHRNLCGTSDQMFATSGMESSLNVELPIVTSASIGPFGAVLWFLQRAPGRPKFQLRCYSIMLQVALICPSYICSESQEQVENMLRPIAKSCDYTYCCMPRCSTVNIARLAAYASCNGTTPI